MSKLTELQSQIHFYQQMINLIPNEMHVKNNQGVYLIVNQFYTKKLVVLGILPDANASIVGKTDFDLFHRKTAEQFYENDQQVIKNKTELLLTEENKLSAKHTQRFITRKKPLYDLQDKVTGIVGSSLEISLLRIQQQAIELSKREVDCVAGIYRGFSAKKIAQLYGLSPRTVESYIDNIKTKLGCSSQSEIIQVILDNQLETVLKYHQVPESGKS